MSGAVLHTDWRADIWAAFRDSLLPWSAVAYAARTLLAVAIALYTAYALQLDSPGSAATTVLIVANASRGAVVSKSVWRIFGSFVGVVAAVVLIAAFAQSPVLFVLGLAAWVGLCTSVSSSFRYNRSYASVLAGYTVALVAIPATVTPTAIFDLALARLSVVSIGVISAGVVFMVTDPGTGPAEFRTPLLRLITGTCRVVAGAFDEGGLAGPRAARGSLATDIAALDQVVEFTDALEAGFSRYAEDVRLAAAELFAMLTGGLRVGMVLRDLHHPADRAAAEMVRETLQGIATAPAGTPATVLAEQVARARAALSVAMQTTQDLTALSGFDQAEQLFAQLAEAVATLCSLEAGKPRRTRLHLRGFVEWRTGRRNGIRAVLAVTIAGLFWIISQWPAGGSLLLIVCVLSALLTQLPSAAAASVAFFKGIIFTAIGSFICTFAVLPRMTGFPLLMLGILPFVLLGLLAQRVPRHAGAATAFLALFFAQVSPANPMVFDLAGGLNSDVALLAGGVFAILSFRVLLPPNPVHEAGAIAESLRRSTRRRPAGSALVFEHVEHQKLLRMSQRLQHLPNLRYEAVGEAVVTVLIGRLFARIRAAAADPALPASFRDAAARAGGVARAVCSNPAAASAAFSTMAISLALTAEALPERRLAANLREVSQLIEYDAAFLRGNGILDA